MSSLKKDKIIVLCINTDIPVVFNKQLLLRGYITAQRKGNLIFFKLYSSCTTTRHLGRRWIQTDIIEVHHTRSAGDRAKAKGNRIYICKVDTLVGKARQVDIPLGPSG